MSHLGEWQLIKLSSVLLLDVPFPASTRRCGTRHTSSHPRVRLQRLSATGQWHHPLSVSHRPDSSICQRQPADTTLDIRAGFQKTTPAGLARHSLTLFTSYAKTKKPRQRIIYSLRRCSRPQRASVHHRSSSSFEVQVLVDVR